MTSGPFTGWLYDGRTAEALQVSVMLEDGQMLVVAPNGAPVLRVPVTDVRLSEPLKNAPRLVNFADGQTLQIDDARQATQALGRAGRPPPLIARLQDSWLLSSIAALLLVGLLVAAYVRGVPAGARWAAEAIPPEVELRMGASLLELLDNTRLRPTELAEAKRAAIAQRFAQMASTVAPGVDYRLEFRSVKGKGGKEQINAFALPGGIIVLLDGLVNATTIDDQVIGVLGHELGHVVHRHSMQRLMQVVGLGALTGLAWGDFSGVAANVPLVLGIFRYSRADERAADEFAVKLLKGGALTVQPLIEFFEIIQSRQGRYASDVPDFLSSHPSTADRIQWLRDQLEVRR